MLSLFPYNLSVQKITCKKTPQHLLRMLWKVFHEELQYYSGLWKMTVFSSPGSVLYDWVALQYFSQYWIPNKSSKVRYHGSEDDIDKTDFKKVAA